MPREMQLVHSPDDIPEFSSEAEESEFWATHQISDELAEQAADFPSDLLPPPRPRTRPVSVRFDESTIQRVRILALRRHKGYQTLLKEFVIERLYEEEKREGVIGRPTPSA